MLGALCAYPCILDVWMHGMHCVLTVYLRESRPVWHLQQRVQLTGCHSGAVTTATITPGGITKLTQRSQINRGQVVELQNSTVDHVFLSLGWLFALHMTPTGAKATYWFVLLMNEPVAHLRSMNFTCSWNWGENQGNSRELVQSPWFPAHALSAAHERITLH